MQISMCPFEIYLRTVRPEIYLKGNGFFCPGGAPIAMVITGAGKVASEQIDHSKVVAQEVKPSLSIEYGKYVAATCTGCHGMDLKGGPIQGAPPEWPPAQNIAGRAMAKWTEEQFLTAIRTGVRPDGSQIAFPMPYQSLKHLTDIELKSIRLYLLSL